MPKPVIIGRATLYNADALDILPTLTSKSVDAIITDPPHGAALRVQRATYLPRLRKNAIRNDDQQEAKALLAECLPHLKRISKPKTAHLFWSSWKAVWMSEMLAEYYRVKGMIVWVKDVWGIGYYTRPQHEIAWYVHRGEPATPRKAESDVWQEKGIPRRNGNRKHPSEKPIALMERSIKLCRPKPGVILDPFAGSGSTGVAALGLGHSFVGIESDPGAFDVMVDRIRTLV